MIDDLTRSKMFGSRPLLGSLLLLSAVLAARVDAQGQVVPRDVRFVDIDGYATRVQVSGVAGRDPRRPIVVFEAGAMSSLETWDSVFSQLVGTAPLVSYDRAGLGESIWDNETPAPRHVSSRLRRLLREIGAGPPYVLVGHSWGGTLMRYFAGNHPSEVVGIVYVDPGPIVTLSLGQELAPFDQIGAGRPGYEAFWSAYASFVETASPAVRAEFNMYRSLMEREVADRDLQPAPDARW